MSGRTGLYVFCYDIESGARRLKVARVLETEGVRVQLSVFELRVTKRRAEALARRISGLIAPMDSFRMYHIPDPALKHCRSTGGAPIPEAGNFLLY